MTVRTLLILGAGGHGRVVADCAEAQGRWGRIAFCDETWPDRTQVGAFPIIAGREAFFSGDHGADVERVVAIGNAAVRLAAFERLRAVGAAVATVIHPSCIVSRRATIGPGSVLVAGAIVNSEAVIGAACIINTAASVDHDCVLADGVHVSPGAHLAGNVRVGRGSWIGVGSAVRQGIRIGANCMVGAGAAVVADVADGLTVVGVPARVLSKRHEGTV